MTADELAKLIPNEVVEAARVSISKAFDARCTPQEARAALAAGLAAWPKVSRDEEYVYFDGEEYPAIILPLQEPLPTRS